MKNCSFRPLILLPLILLQFCQNSPGTNSSGQENSAVERRIEEVDITQKLQKYTPFTLNPDLSSLSDNHRKMIPLLIEASQIMDSLFWYQAYGDADSLLEAATDQKLEEFIRINYGPWDRLDGNAPFIAGLGEKPAGANFYPHDMSKEEFENADLPDKTSQYTFIRRDENGTLLSVPFHKMFAKEVDKVADLLRQAAEFEPEPQFKNYLNLRAAALLNDEYQQSDLAWMDAKNNHLELIIGPIETYEDQLFGYKAAYQGYVLIKDLEWSARLARFARFLPELQQNLPVPDAYKAEQPGTDADLNAYDVIFASGHGNAGSKTIAINLPNDEEVQLRKGARRLQLKNPMQAKFDKILLPLSQELIAEDQRKHITFDAFFANTMFHEVAHGLGIKNTITNSGTVREALKEHASALEEGKADVLGLYMVTGLYEKGELEGSLKDYYTTFLASIFRSIRFGASSAHGKANMIRFNYFKERNAFSRDEESGLYRVDYPLMREAMNELSREILILQGDGNYEGVAEMVDQYGNINPMLQADLDRLAEKNIPVDITYNQGLENLGFE